MCHIFYSALSARLHVCFCESVRVASVSSGPPLMRVPHVRVLYTQHYVVVRAGAGVLSQQSSCLQQRSLARHRHVSRPPRLAVVNGQTDAHRIGAVPYQLLWPGGRERGEEGGGERERERDVLY